MNQKALSLVLAAVTLVGAAQFVHAKPALRRVDIALVKGGFEPKKVTVKRGEPVRLVFTRKVEKTCGKDIYIQVGDGKRVEKHLPLDQPVEVAVAFAKSGELAWACTMEMLGGVILVQ